MIRPRALATLCLALSCASRPPTPPPAVTAPPPAAVRALALEAEPRGRLPEGVTPLRYALTLEVLPAQQRFRGEVDIRVRLDAPRDAVWLHGQGLDVTAATLEVGGQRRSARWEPGAREGIAALRWEGAVGPGEVTLHLAYTAPFNRQLEGLYRVESGGDAYAFTQFEAISARYAMPCFDEPRFKTPFDITLVVARDHAAVTNTPEVASEPRGEGLRAVRFAPTEPLPTYLLAFAVGPLDVVDFAPLPPNDVRATPIPLRGVAPRGKGRFLQRALADTAPLVAAFEAYFQIAYPYPKLDLIAVPDFAAGAMENAGAITFREPLLVLRPDAPRDQVRAMDHVLAHELAHHWFGDLVTLRWWDDIWLNESFATWAATWSTDQVFPQHAQGLALLAGVHGAMGADALSTAVPVRRPIEADTDLRGGSSSIVYQKGAAVLSMFERWMGREAFRDGLRAYLRARPHGTATAADLVAALSAAAGDRPLDATLRGFVDQPGVPVLAAETVCAGSAPRVRFSQRRFALPAGSDTRPGRWAVPVCARYPGDNGRTAEVCGLVDAEHNELPLPTTRCPAWLMPNADGRGYYRWALTPAALRALVTEGWDALNPGERLSVVSNARAMFTAGSANITALRPILARAAADPARLVATEPFGFWTRAVEEHLPPAQGLVARREVARLYAPAWRALGWSPRPDEDADRALYRRDLAGFLGLIAEDPAVRGEGARRGADYLAGRAQLPTELIAPCLAMHLRAADVPAVDAVITRAVTSDDALERFRLLGALGHAAAPALAARVLPLALDPRLRVSEVFTALNVALDRGATRDAAFTWLSANADAVFARISVNGRAGTPWLGARFCDRAQAARVEALFAPRAAAVPGSEAQLRGALEAIAVCAAEREAQGVTLAAAFARAAGAP